MDEDGIMAVLVVIWRPLLTVIVNAPNECSGLQESILMGRDFVLLGDSASLWQRKNPFGFQTEPYGGSIRNNSVFQGSFIVLCNIWKTTFGFLVLVLRSQLLKVFLWLTARSAQNELLKSAKRAVSNLPSTQVNRNIPFV